MSRGDQRDRDRQKAQAKKDAKNKQMGREGNPLQRNLADSTKLEAKIAAKRAKEAEMANAPPVAKPVVRKKVPKKTEDLDDLLNAGLAKGKKSKPGK